MECCGMKGFLTYILLWMLSKKSMTGAGLADELEKRRGTRPSPGTIYPALKELRQKGLVSADEGKVYTLTKKGQRELNGARDLFCNMFYDMKDMSRGCPCQGKRK